MRLSARGTLLQRGDRPGAVLGVMLSEAQP